MAGFFTLHYGGFHWGYYTFLTDFGLLRYVNVLGNVDILFTCGLFIFYHLFSFLYYWHEMVQADRFRQLFVRPYYRIIPMHITLILGGFMYLAALGSTSGKCDQRSYGEVENRIQ